MTIVKKLDWDSAFFGFPIAQICDSQINEKDWKFIDSFCKKEDVHLLQFKCDATHTDSVYIVEKENFHFVDVRMKLISKLRASANKSQRQESLKFRQATSADVIHLQQMTDGMFTHSRYFHDHRFAPEMVNNFYKNWLKKAVEGRFDDCAVLIEKQNEIVAYCTLKFNGQNANIGLFGVGKEFQGLGYGKAMLDSILEYLIQNGYRTATVVTQGRNRHALNVYTQNGFIIDDIQLYYHKWMSARPLD